MHRRHFLQATGSAGLLLLTARPARATRQTTTPTTRPSAQAEAISRIARLADGSPIAAYPWLNRSRAPVGYLHGLAVTFAKLHHDLSAGSPYAAEMARPPAPDADPNKDALKHYQELFQQGGIDLAKSTPPQTLCHLFTLMLGLGMRESSGRYCEGRDRSASNTTAETAEAGLFQTSFNARRAHPLMPKLFEDFTTNPNSRPTYLDLFQQGVRPKPEDLENFGEGPGRTFQQLSKSNPFFATCFAAIGLRNIRKHWGPINRRAAEVKHDADALFQEVQAVVDRDSLGPLL